MNFSDLKFAPRLFIGGVQAEHTFANGYGVSVIRGPGSYGNEAGKYELAVTQGEQLCYDTPITDNVLGWLSEADVTRLLGEVEALEPTP